MNVELRMKCLEFAMTIAQGESVDNILSVSEKLYKHCADKANYRVSTTNL